MSAIASHIPCMYCGETIVSYAQGKGTPKKFCDRHCKNRYKREQREARQQVEADKIAARRALYGCLRIVSTER